MNYAGILETDIVDSISGICVSFWTQGCPHRCKGCHNPQTWDTNGGMELTQEVLDSVPKMIMNRGLSKDFSILGGEPFINEETILMLSGLVDSVKKVSPKSNIYCWTGYTLEELLSFKNDNYIKFLEKLDYLIDGKYEESQVKKRLTLRGSENQKIWKRVSSSDGKGIIKVNKELIFKDISQEIDFCR